MRKNVLTPLLCLILLCSLILSAAAVEQFIHVVDNAALMTKEDTAQLEETAFQISDQYGMDVLILTVNSLDGKSPEEYADDHLDYIADNAPDYYSGILFLLSMEERDLYISTCGDAIYALTDYGIMESTDPIMPYLSDGDYYGAFHTWLTVLPEYLDAFQLGQPIDGDVDDSGGYYHGTQEEIVYYEEDVSPSFILALIIGIAAGGITVACMKASMNTRRKQSCAVEYMEDNSYHLQVQRDIFLYSNVSRRARPKDNPSSGTSRGGGSSVHRSSSGRSHGGGGRKF